tara:strand:+ start:456 stop:1637 length:1182 start_codon:yes stop_codon:yes gene_type:complete
MKSQNTTLKAINYLSIYADKSKDFDAFKYIKRSKSNPLQVSYIKQEKINSLLEYTGIKIKGTDEQRKKYFVNTSINKLLSAMFVNENSRIQDVSIDIDKQFRKDFTSKAEFFISDDVKGFYSRENKEFIYNNNGSCMEGKPANYFDIYSNFLNVKTQIVGLKVGNSVIARAMLWTKEKETFEVCKDTPNCSKKVRTKQYFLDRIYIGNDFKNSNEEQLQLKLHTLVKRMLRVKKLDCYSAYHINRYIESNLLNVYVGKERTEVNCSDSKIGATEPSFSIQIKNDTFHELECYPYADTFRYGKELSENIKFSDDEDQSDYILEDTGGTYTEGSSGFCECCEDRVDEDYLHYSECEEEYLCDNCSEYIEEREDVCREDNATYNSYSGNYHYCHDL